MFVSREWAAGAPPDPADFGPAVEGGVGGAVEVIRDDQDRARLRIPRTETCEALRLRLLRGMAAVLPPQLPSPFPSPCEALAAARELLLSVLGIPARYLDARGDHERWEAPRTVRPVGAPPRPYATPEGWARVGVDVDAPTVAAARPFQDWNVAFHGTRLETLRQILATRMLLLPGDVNAEGKTILPPEGHLAAHKDKRFVLVPREGAPDMLEDYDSRDARHKPAAGAEDFRPARHFFTTPSIRYAARRAFAAPFAFRGRQAQVVLQVRQRPDTIRVVSLKRVVAAAPSPLPPVLTGHVSSQVRQRPDTIRVVSLKRVVAAAPYDECFRNDDLTWFSRAYGPGALVVTGVLFRFADDGQTSLLDTKLSQLDRSHITQPRL